jgi:hypothetical protein
MLTHTYDLLTVRAGDNRGQPYQFGGTLADQKVDVREKHPFLAKVSGMAARLSRGRELKLLGLQFTVDPAALKLTCQATGPLGSLMRKELDRLQDRLAKQSRPLALREGGLVYSLYQPPVPSLRLINSLSMFMMRGRQPVKPTACTLQVTARCQLNLERHYNQQEGYPHVTTQALVNGPEGSGCFGGFTQFYMTAYGDVDPCDFTPLTFGNIRDEPLTNIWACLLSHPAYSNRCRHCRMQDPEFRRQYIDPIPDDVLLPWPAFEELMDRPHGPQAAPSAQDDRGAPSIQVRTT